MRRRRFISFNWLSAAEHRGLSLCCPRMWRSLLFDYFVLYFVFNKSTIYTKHQVQKSDCFIIIIYYIKYESYRIRKALIKVPTGDTLHGYCICQLITYSGVEITSNKLWSVINFFFFIASLKIGKVVGRAFYYFHAYYCRKRKRFVV